MSRAKISSGSHLSSIPNLITLTKRPPSRRQLFFCTGRYNQISHLRRQEASQPAHALDFAHLVGDTLFELFVELDHFPRLRLQLLGSFAKLI